MRSQLHIFISFKSEEHEFASVLRTALVEEGFKVWWQEEIQCGQEWHGEIDKAIEEAGAIVVLWSNASIRSAWVKHEASQAISKQVYAPVRTEIMEIDSPYNRIQATDIINWTGEKNNPGFQNLLERLKRLIPKPIPISQQILNFFLIQRFALILLLITIAAFYLLIVQKNTLNKQIIKQDNLLVNLQRVRDTLTGQFKNANRNQIRLEKITDKIKNSSENSIYNLQLAVNSLEDLGTSQKQILTNIRRNFYIIDPNKINISYDVNWNINSGYVREYLKRVTTFAREQIISQSIHSKVLENNYEGVIDYTQLIDDSIIIHEIIYSPDNKYLEIRYGVDINKNIKINKITIQDNSPLMPDCNISHETSVSDAICHQKLYLRFSKNLDKNKFYLDQRYISFTSFTDNKNNNCLGKERDAYKEEPAEGNSNVVITLNFIADTVSSLNVEYKTNKIIQDAYNGALISWLDLVDSDLEIITTSNGIIFDPIYANETSNFNINIRGLSGGIRIPDIYRVKHKLRTIEPIPLGVFKLKKEYFSKYLFESM